MNNPNIVHRLNAYAEGAAVDALRIADLEAERDTYRELCALLMTHAARLTFLCRAQRIALDDRSRLDGYYSQNDAANRYVDDVAQGRVWARTPTDKPRRGRSRSVYRPLEKVETEARL